MLSLFFAILYNNKKKLIIQNRWSDLRWYVLLRSPLCDAVYNGDRELMDFLVGHCKADLLAEFLHISGSYVSLLHIAAERGHKTILESLHTDYGIDVNKPDSLY